VKKSFATLAVVGMVLSAWAERTESRLEGWTCNGEPVTVPHTWNAVDGADGQGAYPQDKDNSVAGRGYLRTSKTYAVSLPKPRPEKRYFVRFGGAAVTAKVAVNGRYVGEHQGPVTGFAFEITKFLRPHANRLEVAVDNYFDEDLPPIYGDYTVFGGLYRPVTLIETDQLCIDPLVDAGDGIEVETAADGTLRVKTHLNGPQVGAQVVCSIAGQTFIGGEYKVSGVEPWSPESPKLYELTVTVTAGAWTDSVTRKVGFRTAEFKDDGFYLNGVKRQMRGVNYHQEREGKGWAITEQEITEDLEIIRRMGADAIRGAHYSHSQFFCDECDRLGLMGFVEMPASSYVRTNELYLSRIRTATRETVNQCRNHPSIIVWSIFNELYSMWDGHKMGPDDGEIVAKAVQAEVKELDTYHPTTCGAAYSKRVAVNRVPDVYAFNSYPGWYHEAPGASSADLAKNIDRHLKENGRTITGIGEYGGGASIAHQANPFVRPEPGDVFHPEQNQTDLHHIEYGIIKADPRVWGSFVWVMYDFASDNRDEGDARGINDKGLATRDRLVMKDAYYFYKANWNSEPMLYLTGKRLVRTNSDKVQVRGFSNVGAVLLTVNGKQVGTLKPDPVNTVTWNEVTLQPGVNTIELSAGGLVDRCNWICEQVETTAIRDK